MLPKVSARYPLLGRDPPVEKHWSKLAFLNQCFANWKQAVENFQTNSGFSTKRDYFIALFVKNGIELGLRRACKLS